MKPHSTPCCGGTNEQYHLLVAEGATAEQAAELCQLPWDEAVKQLRNTQGDATKAPGFGATHPPRARSNGW